MAALVVLAGALIVRVINLDADPSALLSRDFVTDEGWWAHNARNAFFYGEWRIDQFNQGLYSAYLYNSLLYFTIKLLGVSFTSIRLLPAAAGWLSVVLLFVLVRRGISARAAVIACVLLAFSNIHIVYSRIGFAETTIVFFLALMLWLWSLRGTHFSFALLSGVALGLMLMTKVTAIYFIPGFVLLIVAEAIRQKTSLRQTVAFVCGAAFVGLAFALLFLIPNFRDWLSFNLANGAGTEWSVTPSALVYSMLKLLGSSFYAKAPLVTAVSLLALCLLVVQVSREGFKKAIGDASELELASAALLIGYLFSLSLTVYQPERRFLPALFLMTILSAGILEKGWAALREITAQNYRMSATGWFVVLFLLPTIGILEFKRTSVTAGLGLLIWLFKGVLIGGLIFVAVAISRGLAPKFRRFLLIGSMAIFFLLFSLLSLAMIYKALALWGFDREVWKSAADVERLKIVLIGSLIVSAATGFLYMILRPGSVLGSAAVSRACSRVFPSEMPSRRDACAPSKRALWLVGAFLLIEGFQISTWLLQPTYSLKEASRALADSLTSDDRVVTYYETVLVPSAAQVICRSTRRGFNVDAFERFNPQYTLILRRDNWRDYTLDNMPIEEWPPPLGLAPSQVASFDLCPTRLGGPRFVLELYRLDR